MSEARKPHSTAAEDSAISSTFDLSRRDLLKSAALGAFAVSEGVREVSAAATVAGAGAVDPIDLVFDEPADRPAGSTRWPVTVGVPFANGVLQSADTLGLAIGGTPAPAQITPALNWRRGDKTISWVHCDFQTTIGAAAAPVQLHADKPNPAPTPAVRVLDEGTHYRVDTGVAKFTCHKKNFSLFDEYTASGQPLIKASSLYWQDAAGSVYEGKHGVSQVEVEKSGPLRAVLRYDGWYQLAGGDARLRFSIWIHAFAGLPYVRIYNKLIWTENLTLYVKIAPSTGLLTTQSLFADRSGVNSYIAHGWSTGEEVKWAYSHSDIDTRGANQYYDNTSERGQKTIVLPTVKGAPIDRSAPYYINVKSDSAFTLHRTVADALNGTSAIEFVDEGIFRDQGVTYGGRHYLQIQRPPLVEWGLRFTLAQPAAHASVDVAGAAHPATYDLRTAEAIVAHQATHGAATLTPAKGGTVTHVHNLAGWADARFATSGGLAVSVKGLAQQTPKVLAIDAQSVTVKLWGGSPMSLAEEDRVHKEYVENGYPKEWLAFSGEPNPVGISKTHEIWLWPAEAPATNRLINDLVQRPVACCPTPRYAATTNYLVGLREREKSPPSYEFVETALENMLRYLTARDNAHNDYEEWNFGDLRLFRNGSFRTWDNGGYNCSDLFWWQWYRTGKRFFLEEGINNARHVMDVDTMSHSQTVTGGYNNFLRIAGRTHYYAALQWGWPVAYGDLYVDHPSYLLLCWLMTGYEVARTVLETKCQERRNAGHGDPGNLSGYRLAGTTREQYGAIRPKFVYYEFTGEEQFYTAGRQWLQLAMNAQAASIETNGRGTKLFPNNNFWGFFYESFLQAYQYDKEPDVLTSIAQTVDDFAVAPTSEFDAPTFKCTWPAPSRLGRTRYSTMRFAAAYKKSGDPRFLQYPVDKMLRQCRTIQTTQLQRGYDAIAGILAPGFLRESLLLLGTLADAGFPDVRWPGNLPLFGSRPIAGAPWVSQLTLWVTKEAGKAGRIRLIFKDANLTTLESPGRMRAVIFDPAGKSTSLLLTKDATCGAKLTGKTLSLADRPHLVNGQPIRFSTTGKLPRPLEADRTYFVNVASTSPELQVTVHAGYVDGVAGVNPLPLQGGSGPLTLIMANTLSDVSFSLSAAQSAGSYRIHLQAESQVFRVAPASDMPGLVVELAGVNDLAIDTTLGPAEYHFRLRDGRNTLALSTTHAKCHLVQPVAVLDLNRNVLGRFEYDAGTTVAAELPIAPDKARNVLKLAKGAEEYSPTGPYALPLLRMTGAERYIAVSPSQWFNPLTDLNKNVVAFWSLAEATGTRHDATNRPHALSEFHGPIEHESEGPLGGAALFKPPGNSFLSTRTAALPARGSFTIWGWARLDQFADTRYLFVKGGDIASNPASCEWAVYALPTPSGRLILQARVGKKYVFTPPLPFGVDGQMHLVVAWHDAQAKRVFLQLDNQPSVSLNLDGPINSGDQPFSIGGCAANGRGWIGAIAAVGFANAVLTERERNLLYNGGAGLQYPL